MVEISSKEREILPSRPGAQKGPPHEGNDSDRVLEHSRELVQGIEGMVEGAEGVEMGEVSEKSGEDRKKSSGGGAGATSKTATTSTTKSDEPSFEVMAIQIRTHLKQEIAVLQKEAKKYQKGHNFSPYKFNEIIGRIRRLREILAELVTAASGKIRQLWQEYVKG